MPYGEDALKTRKVVTITGLKGKKAAGEPITMLTAYDFPTAQIEDELGIDMILCGDSMGNTVYGYKGTISVTMEQMLLHAEAVKRGAPHSFVVGDMPFLSYQVSVEQAIQNAGRLMKEAGVDGIKLEGGREMADRVRAIATAGIPVMGHIGLTPQSVSALGGFRAQGRDLSGAVRLIEDAKILEDAGAFALVLEAIPAQLGELITERVDIPTIGIGAGPHTDGQVLVVHDALGFFGGHVAKFVKQYANLNQVMKDGLRAYMDDVAGRTFPAAEHCYGMGDEVLAQIKEKFERDR
ncbi:3-methyl-2-oxobutanoate hydroxymethyltransferase [Peptococcaceae bacterium CEB3]|nr:3-methyl-2-oxobutanoate hydroxymethyltransferase [Peptococcaceae bacterium CEB3]